MRNAGLLESSKVQKSMSMQETLDFLANKGVLLEPDEEAIFNFSIVYTQQEIERKKRYQDDEKSHTLIVQHKNTLYSASALMEFNRTIENSSSILSQLSAFFSDDAYIAGLTTANKFIIPCLLTRSTDSYNLKCAVSGTQQ